MHYPDFPSGFYSFLVPHRLELTFFLCILSNIKLSIEFGILYYFFNSNDVLPKDNVVLELTNASFNLYSNAVRRLDIIKTLQLPTTILYFFKYVIYLPDSCIMHYDTTKIFIL